MKGNYGQKNPGGRFDKLNGLIAELIERFLTKLFGMQAGKVPGSSCMSFSFLNLIQVPFNT